MCVRSSAPGWSPARGGGRQGATPGPVQEGAPKAKARLRARGLALARLKTARGYPVARRKLAKLQKKGKKEGEGPGHDIDTTEAAEENRTRSEQRAQ